MNEQINIERDVRMALGDLTLQLIVARAENQTLREQLAALTPEPAPPEKAKPNGKAKEAADEPNGRSQPN